MSLLFSPLYVRDVRFPNRVVMPPMVRELADEAGCVTAELVAEYAQRAAAGTGLIIVEASAVDQAGRCWRGGLNAYAEEHLPGLARLAGRIRSEGAVAGIQLVHGGPHASAELCGGFTLGPSAVRPKQKYPVPRELSLEEILTIQAQFADSASLAVQAGFELLEIHGAHGYLLDSFLSPKRNRRSDGYGGPMANRMRMLVETCQTVKQRIGERALLDCRISLFYQIAEEFTPADLHTLVAGLESTGIDILHLSTNGSFRKHFDPPQPLGTWVKGMTNLPLITAGGIRQPSSAERAIAQGIADLVAVGKAMLSKPDWTSAARRKLDGGPPKK